LLLVLLLLPALAEAQRPQGPGPRPGAPARRAELESEILDRFMDRVAQEMKLDAAARQQLSEQLRANGERRRALARSAVQLRQQLVRAVEDSTSADADIQRLLGQLEQLRQQENDQWATEQQELARVLTPRQRAIFSLEWLRFNERVRGMMMERRPQQRRQ
jgi:Spy/CpxP family protein refolding chaperone